MCYVKKSNLFCGLFFRNNFKSYSLESRLHFRVHATLNKIHVIQKGGNVDSKELMEEGLARLSPMPPSSEYPSISRSPSPNKMASNGTNGVE